jgi:nicotinate-nucleotide adenylyltransferase
MPLLLALAGLALLGWHVAAGTPAVGAVAAVGGIAAAGLCMPLRLKRGQRRMVLFGFGALLCLGSAIPGLPFPAGVLAWWVAGSAFLAPLRTCTQGTRRLLLAGAALCALLALLAWRGVLPTTLSWLLLAAAFHLGAQVLSSRPIATLPAPVGPTVAVFGGTFDPFHRGHRALVEAAVRQTDRVLVVVAGTPPHKQSDADRTAFHHRVAMTRLGVEGLPRVEVLEMEGRRQGPSYTVDTLRSLTKTYPPGTRFKLVMGADAFQEFPTWHDWEGILELSTLLVAARPGHDLDAPPEFEGRNMPVERLESSEVDVSASRLRGILAEDGDVGDRLAPAVRTYVRDHRLYQPGGAGSGEVELADAPPPRP